MQFLDKIHTVFTATLRVGLAKCLVPNRKNGFGPFSYKFFVPIRVGLTYEIPPDFRGGVHLFI